MLFLPQTERWIYYLAESYIRKCISGNVLLLIFDEYVNLEIAAVYNLENISRAGKSRVGRLRQ